MPRFARECLAMGTGRETTLARDESAFYAVRIHPSALRGAFVPDPSTTLFGDACASPLGVSPSGVSGLMWPGSERALAELAARRDIAEGVDGVWVSYHGGRQLDAAPAAIDASPLVRARLGSDATVLMDGGVRGGLDALRALHLGADFVLAGRPFVVGVATLGAARTSHAPDIIEAELANVVTRLGIVRIDQARGLTRA